MGKSPNVDERLFVARSARRSAPPDAEHRFHDAVDLATGRIETAVAGAVRSGEVTRDIGGTLGTRAAGAAILRRLG